MTLATTVLLALPMRTRLPRMQIARPTRYLGLDDVDESEARDPEFFEQMTNAATPFAARDRERREVALGVVVRW